MTRPFSTAATSLLHSHDAYMGEIVSFRDEFSIGFVEFPFVALEFGRTLSDFIILVGQHLFRPSSRHF